MSTDTATRLEFFTDCVEREAADAKVKGGRVYYFKLAEPPQEITALYIRFTDPEIWEPWWAEYLTLKYEALTIFNRKRTTSTEEILGQLGLDADYAEIVERWGRLAPLESRVYRLRVEQIGDHKTVKSAWYDDIPGFDRWVASCDAGNPASTGEAEVDKAAHEARLAEALDAALVSTEPDAKERQGVAALHSVRAAIVERLGEDGVEQLYVVGQGGVSPIDEVAVDIAAMTLNLAAQRQRELKQHVDALMAIIKASFNASVVDFLLLRRRTRVEQLEFLTTTAEVNESERSQLEHEAAYSRPVGITGAVLVAQHDHKMFHVGTNLLEDDPRQSPSHRSAYERLYGQLKNFWVFPLHLGDELLGALRVVNRLDNEGNVVPWPFLQRRRLVGLMKFVGALWQAYGVEIPIDDLEAPPQHIGEAAKVSAERRLSAAEGLALGARGEMNGETLASVLSALATLSEIRIEENHLRATALIVAPDQLGDIAHGLPEGRFEALSRIPSLSELDKASTQDGNVLVVRTDGRIMGRVRARVGERLNAQQLASQLEAEFSLCISANHERVVEVWGRGNHVADYAFVMRSGVWRLRDFSAGAEELVRMTDFSAELLENLVRKMTRLSYFHGAIVVVWDGPVPTHFPDRGNRINQSLETLANADFDEYASKDGGCIVSSTGALQSTQVKFPASPPTFSDSAAADRFRTTQRRLRESLRGTRHEGALAASAHLADAVVLCASENRTVCAFMNGGAILWDH